MYKDSGNTTMPTHIEQKAFCRAQFGSGAGQDSWCETIDHCWSIPNLHWCLAGNGWEWGNGTIINHYRGSFPLPRSLLSTSKQNMINTYDPLTVQHRFWPTTSQDHFHGEVPVAKNDHPVVTIPYIDEVKPSSCRLVHPHYLWRHIPNKPVVNPVNLAIWRASPCIVCSFFFGPGKSTQYITIIVDNHISMYSIYIYIYIYIYRLYSHIYNIYIYICILYCIVRIYIYTLHSQMCIYIHMYIIYIYKYYIYI